MYARSPGRPVNYRNGVPERRGKLDCAAALRGHEVFAALCAMVGLSTSQPCPCRAAQLASPPLMVSANLLMANSVVVMEATNSLVPRAKQNSRLSRCSP